MLAFHAISQTVNLASPSMISFIFETISLRPANFGLPDFGAFFMDSTPDLLFFPALSCVIRHTRRPVSSRKFNHQLLQGTGKFKRALM